MDYEKKRLNQIQENKRMLLDLGLTSDLRSEQMDTKYCENLFSSEHVENEACDVFMVILPHFEIPSEALLREREFTLRYRNFILEQASRAYNRLTSDGFFIVGVKDCRFVSGDQDLDVCDLKSQLIPLSVLVYHDISSKFNGEYRLKELIAVVPDGLARDREMEVNELKDRWKEDIEEWNEEKEFEAKENDYRARRVLPIVHSCYMMFQKYN